MKRYCKLIVWLAVLGALVGGSWNIAHGQPFVPIFVSRIIFGSTAGVVIRSSTGTPEAAVTAPIGSLFLRSDGAAGTALYIKESGSGNTGWAAVASGGGITASSTNTLTNKTIDAEGTGNVLTIPFTEWWPAATCTYSASGTGAQFQSFWDTSDMNPPSDIVCDYTNAPKAFANFNEAGVVKIYKHWKLPSDWTGAIDLKIYWYSTATTGNVVWQISTACLANGEVNDPASFNTAQTITDATQGTASRLNLASLTGVTTTGCAADEVLYLQLMRDPGHASDTLGADAKLLGVEWIYRRAL